MAKKFVKAQQVMLRGVRAKWLNLDKPDYTNGAAGKYTVGVFVTDAIADMVNPIALAIASEAEVPAPAWGRGDILNVKMTASGVNKKTGEKWEETPKIYNADMTPATAETIKKINTKSTLNVAALFSPYQPTPVAPTGGVTVKLEAIQIVALVGAEPTATDYGFAPVTADDESEEY